MSGVLPGDLGRRHRVGTFLDGLQTGNAEDDDFIADYGRAGAAEVASSAALAVRLRLLGWLGGTGGNESLSATSCFVSDTFRGKPAAQPTGGTMKAPARVIAVAVAAIAAIGTLAVTPASGASPRPDDRQGGGDRTLRFDVHFRDFTKNYVDLGATGPTVGDLLVFQDTLLDPVSHQQVGTEGGTCTITNVQNGFQTHCVGTAALTGGQISFQGLATDAPVKPLAVVGGTDKYEGACGELTLVENGDGTNTGRDDGTGTLTIDLRNGHS